VRGYVEDMVNLKGKFYMSGDWRLPCIMNRGQPMSKIKEIKKNTDPITFAFNYGSEWIGSHTGAVVDITKLESLRTIENPEYIGDGESEYYLGVDVARSNSAKNASTVVVVVKVLRRDDGRVSKMEAVNIQNIDSSLKMSKQAEKIKKIKNDFDAVMVVVDVNGLGVGLKDALMDESFDDEGNDLGVWNTINTDDEPAVTGAESCMFAFMPQKYNNDAIVNFMGVVKSEKIRLLSKKSRVDNLDDIAHVQTDFLISEIDNLKRKDTRTADGKVTVEQIKKTIAKDKYSALIYVLWYIMSHEDNSNLNTTNTQAYINALSY
jgi:ribonucleoside-diphosphate reductase alpha chain